MIDAGTEVGRVDAEGQQGRWRSAVARVKETRSRLTLSGPGADRVAELLAARSRRSDAPRARFTGRAAVLLLVLAVLTVSYASSLRAYVQQRAHTDELRTQIEKRDASIRALEREKARWQDPAYQEAQARTRLRYVMPGEIGFTVIGPDGRPVDEGEQVELRDPTETTNTDPTPWWEETWASLEAAGDPPVAEPKKKPNQEIDGTKPEVSQGKSDQ